MRYQCGKNAIHLKYEWPDNYGRQKSELSVLARATANTLNEQLLLRSPM
jgi:hypothetical protein